MAGVPALDLTGVAEITTMLGTSVGSLLPVGIAIMGIMVGVKLIPRIIYTFL